MSDSFLLCFVVLSVLLYSVWKDTTSLPRVDEEYRENNQSLDDTGKHEDFRGSVIVA